MSRWSATPMPSRRTIFARPAPSTTPSRPTNGCSRSSWSCFGAANSTRSGSPTRRFRSSKPSSSSERKQLVRTPNEDSVEAAIDRIMHTYDLLMNRSAAASTDARAKLTDYIAKLIEAGEKDMDRLTVCGLTYLRELDGSNDPVKAGFTGL